MPTPLRLRPLAIVLSMPLLLAALAGRAAAESASPAAALVARSIDAMRSDPEASRRLAEDALQALRSRPDADLAVRAHLQLCDYYAERDSAQAEAQASAASAALPQAQRRALAAGLYNCQGELAENAGDYAKAQARFEQAVSAAQAAHDDEMLADSLYQRGYLRGVRGDYASGLADLRQAHHLYEHAALPQRAVTTLIGIAILYHRLGDNEQARHYYEQSLALQRVDGSKREVAVTEHNLGRVYESLRQWDAAQQAFEATLQLSREIDYPRGEAYALRGLASVHNAKGDAQGALNLLQLAELLQRRLPDERLRAQILLQRGVALRALKRPDDAAAALGEALSVFQRVDSLQETVDTQRTLALTHADAGDWQAAYREQRAYGDNLERGLRTQLDQRFAALKVEFDTNAKERENAYLLREQAATNRTLEQTRRANRLQAAVIALGGALLLLLAVLLVHHRRTARQMRALALTDELTGLPNRREVLSRLRALLGERNARPCAVLVIDLDHFKSVNDEFGHPAGDEVLKAVAQVLRAAVGDAGHVGRLGGEEFIALLPHSDEAQALDVGERIRQQVQGMDTSPWLHAGWRMTASLGLAVSRPGEDDLRSLLHRADQALYRAKASGRNQVLAEAA